MGRLDAIHVNCFDQKIGNSGTFKERPLISNATLRALCLIGGCGHDEAGDERDESVYSRVSESARQV